MRPVVRLQVNLKSRIDHKSSKIENNAKTVHGEHSSLCVCVGRRGTWEGGRWGGTLLMREGGSNESTGAGLDSWLGNESRVGCTRQ